MQDTIKKSFNSILNSGTITDIRSKVKSQTQRFRDVDVQKLKTDFLTLVTVFRHYCHDRYNQLNKVQILMYITFLWAWIGLYMTKVFELFFKLILALPNSYYQVLSFKHSMLNTQGKKVNIISAANERGDDITEKFKLFLRWYWENSSDQAYDVNSFDYNKYVSMLGSSILYCSYLLQDVNNDRPQNIWTSVKRLFTYKDVNNRYYYASHSDLLDREELPFGRVHFDEVEKLSSEPGLDVMHNGTNPAKKIRTMEQLIHAMNQSAESDARALAAGLDVTDYDEPTTNNTTNEVPST